jgi:hypothetical protein
MARTNYSYEKRQRELAKQRKKEEKRLRKLRNPDAPDAEAPDAEAPALPGNDAPEEPLSPAL